MVPQNYSSYFPLAYVKLRWPVLLLLLLFIYFLSFLPFSRAAPSAYGGSQARGPVGAVAAGLRDSHSSLGSETCL